PTSDYTSRKVSIVVGPSASNASLGRTHAPPSRMGMVSGGRLPRHETDAGRIDVDTGDDFGTLPPQYDVVFSGGHLNGEQSAIGGPNRRSPKPEPSTTSTSDTFWNLWASYAAANEVLMLVVVSEFIMTLSNSLAMTLCRVFHFYNLRLEHPDNCCFPRL
ncbi:hypothetical protein F5146DRAFT_1052713, partial [Armillaria mellea]